MDRLCLIRIVFLDPHTSRILPKQLFRRNTVISKTIDRFQSCTTSPNNSHPTVQFFYLVPEVLLVFFRQMILKLPGTVVEREVEEDFIVIVLDEEYILIGIATILFMDGQITIIPMVIRLISVAHIMEDTQMDVEAMVLAGYKAEAGMEEVEVEILTPRPNHLILPRTTVDTGVGVEIMDHPPLTVDTALVQHLPEVPRHHTTTTTRMEEMMTMVGTGPDMEAMAIFRVDSAERPVVK